MIFPARLLAVMLVGSMALPAAAQTYPTRPVRVIEPHPAGSVVDNGLRGATQALGLALGQPFVIENRVGAEGMIGAEACARAAPDGYTLCATDALVISLNPLIRAKLSYDPQRDFIPIVQLGSLASVAVAHPSLPAKSMSELLEYARSKPGEVTWGSWGLTSLSHLYIEWLKNARGVKFLNVPYKSALQSTQALVAGEIMVSLFGAGNAAPLAKAGKLRVLAVNGEVRSAIVPEAPSFKELGIDVLIRTWFGLFAPTGTPREIVQRINAVVARALADPEFRLKFLASQGWEAVPPAGASPEEFAAFLRAEREMCEKAVKISGVREE